MGLVVAVVEILKEALKHQAVRRMEHGTLSDAEVERLGAALMEMDRVVDEIKEEYGVKEAVRSVREGLDQAMSGLLGAAARCEKEWHDEKNTKEIETP